MNATVKKKGLGRGLEALLGAKDAGSSSSGGVATLKLNQLQAGKYQPRKNMVDASLQELASSIKEQGIMQPLLVRPVAGGKFEIIAGERRYRAATIAGLQEVPVLIKQADDQATAAMALIENMQREDLNALEEANGLSRLIEEFGYTHDKAAQAVGKSRSTVSNLLRLIQLAKPVQAMLIKGDIDMGHARALLPLDSALQVSLAQKIAIQRLSVREAEKMATKLVLSKKPLTDKQKSEAKVDPDLKRIQERLADEFNLNVEIKQKRQGGEIKIKFSQFDELDALFKRLALD
ncbi:ParB/RepB/Spo0J family partition protein [Polynucleobacter sp. 30F-ANTBAC]|uniref:ParB/RepB/Spo0J family partition protein n=1 Tax=Polynucleobacter sp. 30F-ANTBAC TaxID=2689095 RepID=UPI001C0B1689|nr:ParB/RepB/Spo0J family partition protein [Polynucleobacter sp. 30F-ANTBAC]MBU3600008.1 ParB/RepB/Spo0J family partition protein [Polynucleobacter sp. 30F-ANTBAC]